MPVSAAAASTGSPCRVNGPAQAITAAQGSSSSRSVTGSSTEATAVGTPPSSLESAASFSLFRPETTKSAPRRCSSWETSLPVNPVAP